ncbi:MAG: TonB-dependent receptor [Candidatus Marinimicrobia bacterium]|nr:TonB-dependent receptor [Candidatus Neomarinimicrobiota bacterium]MCF7827723.1 TonB-dependent receptor [Candidatus Neomarinimicrobiota bacterium]MCF7881222.1 TonB-dependent receptor [Candidatus Neomarinimicrobiota bacterium]
MVRYVLQIGVLLLGCIGIAMAQTGTIQGTVTNKQTREPLIGVNIILQGTNYGAATDENGRYVIPDVETGIYTVVYSMIGYEKQIITDVLVNSNQTMYKNVNLRQSYLESDEEITVTAYSYFTKEEEIPVSYRNLNYEEVRRSPGAREDVGRMVQNLPGVSPSTDDRNDLIIRGGSPSEVLYMIDNIEIPNPNHFPTQGATGGPISMVNSQFIEDVNFMAGGFPAKYGQKLSGVMDINYRNGNREGYDGKFDLSFAGLGANFEGPFNEGQGAWMFALHRSFLDFASDFLNYGGVPIYANTQGKVVYDLTSDTKLSVIGVGGTDRITIQPTLETDDFAVGDTVVNSYQWVQNKNQQYTFGANLSKIWTQKLHSNFTVSRNETHFFTDVNMQDKRVYRPDDDDLESQVIETYDLFRNASVEVVNDLKTDWVYLFESGDELHFGGYGRMMSYNHEIIFTPTPDDTIDSYGRRITADTTDMSQNWTPKAGIYVDYKRQLKPLWAVNIGLRYDFFDLLNTHDLAPRVSTSYQLSNKLTVNAATGIFYQSPELITITGDSGNKNRLTSIRSDHYIVGMEYLVTDATLFSVEIFRKNYFDYPVSSDTAYDHITMANSGASYGSVGTGAGVSEGFGHATGIEFLLQKKSIENLYGLVSYSYSVIEHAALDDVLRPGAFDNRHVLNIVAGYRFSKRWEISGKWRFAGGRPYTPFDREASIAAGEGRSDLDRIHSERYDPYHRLDLRFDHRTYYKNFTLVSYFSVENVYNRQNEHTRFWNNDTKETVFAHQTGIFPVGGFSLEF